MTSVAISQYSTAQEQRQKLRRSLKAPLIILGVFLLCAVVVYLAAPQQSSDRFAPNNPGKDGAMALAEVLGREGVNVSYVEDRGDALKLAKPGTTLLVANDPDASAQMYQDILSSGSEVVLLSPGEDLVAEVMDQAGLEMELSAGFPDEATKAQCTLPAAVAAQQISPSNSVFDYYLADSIDSLNMDENGNQLPPAGAIACFPQAWGWQLLQVELENDTTVTMLYDSAMWSNSKITSFGNAALALHLLGGTEQLTWYLPGNDVTSPLDEEGSAAWPQWFSLILTVGALSAVFIALWQGRRFGPIITEQLPVVVKASETTYGRGRMYQKAGAQDHAAAALRSGSATRLGARLGVAASSHSQPFISAVALASGKSESEIHDLFYGPAPTNDLELTVLAQNLATLESEINA